MFLIKPTNFNTRYFFPKKSLFIFPLLVSFLYFLIFFSCARADEAQKDTFYSESEKEFSTETGESEFKRSPFFSGQFYPSDPDELKRMTQDFLKNASPEKEQGALIALVSPHAGYIYSGQIAAYSYKLLENKKIDTVILIGSSHRFPLKGISVWPKGFYITPLGKVRIDKDIAARIYKSSKSIKFEPQAHLLEHSLEVQLPFLQSVLEDFKIVPILVNSLEQQEIDEISKELASLLRNPGVILIASTDLSHYHSYDKAASIDKNTLSAIKTGNPVVLRNMVKKGEAELCGEMAVILLLETTKRIHLTPEITLLKYANSGDTAGSKDKVVGYAALSIAIPGSIKSPGAENRDNEKNISPLSFDEERQKDFSDEKLSIRERGENKLMGEELLNNQEKKKLLQIARASIVSHLLNKELSEINVTEPGLLEPRGTFVTLHKKGMLRGCIGYIKALMPLYKAVSECAVSAAVKDYRFPPLKQNELEDIDIEISVLTPLKKIDDIKQIEIGKHGIYILQPPNSGLLLPQVATQYGWDTLTFLAQTCKKAGLPSDAWQKGADIYIFSAQIFGEKEG